MELECVICLEVFQNPRMLPCQHTFCGACLDRLPCSSRNKNEIQCPSCRRQHTIPGNGFPLNRLVANRLSNVQSLHLSTQRELQAPTQFGSKVHRGGNISTARMQHESPYTEAKFSMEHVKSGHIMLSYNKNSKEMVLRIYKTLTGRGYKVWMDDYDMKGDTLDAMAEAVEDSQIFIMCMSSGYLASKNCEKEAKFATNLDKTIIPLKMEKDFIPGRWLGIILGTKKFYDFSGKYPIEMKMGELLDEIKRIYKP